MRTSVLAWGANRVHEYGPAECDAALYRKFHRAPNTGLVLDGCLQGQRFVAACAAWGLAHGVLHIAHVNEGGDVCELRLTPQGRERYA